MVKLLRLESFDVILNQSSLNWVPYRTRLDTEHQVLLQLSFNVTFG